MKIDRPSRPLLRLWRRRVRFTDYYRRSGQYVRIRVSGGRQDGPFLSDHAALIVYLDIAP